LVTLKGSPEGGGGGVGSYAAAEVLRLAREQAQAQSSSQREAAAGSGRPNDARKRTSDAENIFHRRTSMADARAGGGARSLLSGGGGAEKRGRENGEAINEASSYCTIGVVNQDSQIHSQLARTSSGAARMAANNSRTAPVTPMHLSVRQDTLQRESTTFRREMTCNPVTLRYSTNGQPSKHNLCVCVYLRHIALMH